MQSGSQCRLQGPLLGVIDISLLDELKLFWKWIWPCVSGFSILSLEIFFKKIFSHKPLPTSQILSYKEAIFQMIGNRAKIIDSQREAEMSKDAQHAGSC